MRDGCSAYGVNQDEAGNPRKSASVAVSDQKRSAALGGSVGAVSDAVTVVWDDEFLSYDWGVEHPMNPVRLALTISLARRLGVLDRPGVTVVRPRQIGRAHV